jgi:hypothetical protein
LKERKGCKTMNKEKVNGKENYDIELKGEFKINIVE